MDDWSRGRRRVLDGSMLPGTAGQVRQTATSPHVSGGVKPVRTWQSSTAARKTARSPPTGLPSACSGRGATRRASSARRGHDIGGRGSQNQTRALRIRTMLSREKQGL